LNRSLRVGKDGGIPYQRRSLVRKRATLNYATLTYNKVWGAMILVSGIKGLFDRRIFSSVKNTNLRVGIEHEVRPAGARNHTFLHLKSKDRIGKFDCH
jgi:hypothetical protein